jgi:hypothetical protein
VGLIVAGPTPAAADNALIEAVKKADKVAVRRCCSNAPM